MKAFTHNKADVLLNLRALYASPLYRGVQYGKVFPDEFKSVTLNFPC